MYGSMGGVKIFIFPLPYLSGSVILGISGFRGSYLLPPGRYHSKAALALEEVLLKVLAEE